MYVFRSEQSSMLPEKVFISTPKRIGYDHSKTIWLRPNSPGGTVRGMLSGVSISPLVGYIQPVLLYGGRTSVATRCPHLMVGTKVYVCMYDYSNLDYPFDFSPFLYFLLDFDDFFSNRFINSRKSRWFTIQRAYHDHAPGITLDGLGKSPGPLTLPLTA